MTDKILPCPFCGGEADYYEDRSGYADRHVIECMDCACCKRSEYYKSVFREWNQRYNVETPPLDIDKTTKLVDDLSLLLLKARNTLKENK